MKFGYLHIRKAEGRLHGTSALADNGGPVVVVEGMSDTAAAMDLGFDGVGRPSNLACMDMLAIWCGAAKSSSSARTTRRADGSWPGREGMIAAFQMVQDGRQSDDAHAARARQRLRAWVSKYKLTRDEVPAIPRGARRGARRGTGARGQPAADDRPCLPQQSVSHGGRYTLRRWAGTWYRYGGAKYEPVTDECSSQPIYPWSHDKQVRHVDAKTGSESLQPLVANNTMVANLAEAVMSETLVQYLTIPCWINGKGPNPRDLIVFSNGILHVPAFLNGEPEAKYLLDSTPDLFTTVALPFAFDPTASARRGRSSSERRSATIKRRSTCSASGSATA
jgi:hypothetical protein